MLFRRHGITSAQYYLLRILRGAGDCGLLMRMERLGLLVRHRDSSDRRMVTAIATEGGLQLLDELEAPLRELQERQFAMLSEDEIEALTDGLEKVREGTARIPG